MPKSAKKKKDKAADFTKTRLKLGKGRQAATNEVDTSFKARYAILGLKELFDSHPEVLHSNLSVFIASIVRLIGDEEDLIPHSHILLLYTTSAQTHIFPEIRIDAVRFLDILLEKIPDALVDGLRSGNGHGQRILEGYLGLLSAGTKFATSTASVTLTPASKLVILNSLSTFLRHSMNKSQLTASNGASSSAGPALAWYLESAFRTPEAFLEFETLLTSWRSESTNKQTLDSIHRLWKEFVENDDDDDQFLAPPRLDGQNWMLHDLTNLLETPLAGASLFEVGRLSFVSHLLRTLHSTLVAVFLDYAPAAFAPSGTPSETDMGLVISVLRIARTLYEEIVRKSEKVSEAHIQELESLLGFLATYFPAHATANKNMKFVNFIDEYNLIYCELASFLLITSKDESQRSSRKRRKASESLAKRRLLRFTEAGGVSEFIEQKLQGRSDSSGVSTPIKSSTYQDFLPTIWTFIDEMASNSGEKSNPILLATLEHAIKMSSKAPTKRMTVEFVSRLILTILLALLRILQRPSKLVEAETVSQLQARISPYFTINHAVRGRVAGPYTKLPAASPLRRLALDMVSVLQMRAKLKSEATGNLSSAVNHAVEGTTEEKYWSHVGSAFS
ncbi:hypothetical protein FA15DRAFT_579745 [Coprinopsis marcescibilis]|uniref:Pre-rRNA-processing protein Ipi1 N-terminal domain-containing protein n=1 Tax=Coprinopsis marcescibilis TaxID=230819 RepID=A0A5C3LF18_COPMA|nr:hypothetical protein FA15DRAFT_579745 [Coprinopsis marcescibilis]